jgi:hypothetical protein
MNEVGGNPLIQGHTFPNKCILLSQVVEESILYGVQIGVSRSSKFQFVVKGSEDNSFVVKGSFSTRNKRIPSPLEAAASAKKNKKTITKKGLDKFGEMQCMDEDVPDVKSVIQGLSLRRSKRDKKKRIFLNPVIFF